MRAGEPLRFELALPPLALEAGAVVRHHVVRGWHWGPPEDRAAILARARAVDAPRWQVVRRAAAELAAAAARAPAGGRGLSPAIPTVLVIHALTGDEVVGGDDGWWAPLVGRQAALDPSEVRVLCFNLLGSCYGTSGPADGGFPRLTDDDAPAELAPARGGFPLPAVDLPATITTWDQARSILAALDALAIDRVELVVGGSLGGMVALALAALDPGRFARLAPIAACAAASSWILAWNHVGRQAILSDPGFPDDVGRGLELARQLAIVSYRAEPSLERTQGRRQGRSAGPDAPWSSRARYRIQTYLEHQGGKLRARFDARAYLALLGAMDHHDLGRAPDGGPGWGLARIRASTLAVAIDSDQLYRPEHTAALVDELTAHGRTARALTLTSVHGHDAFLVEWPQLDRALRAALALPAAQTVGAWRRATSSPVRAAAGR